MSSLIDAEMVKEQVKLYFNKFARDGLKTEIIERATNDIAEVIDNVPIVVAEPIRHGHWEKIDTAKLSDCTSISPIYKCSFCGSPFVGERINNWYHYCPNCGAKMDNTIINNINDSVKTNDDEIIRCKDCKHWFYFWESEKHHCTESDKHLWDCPIREEDDFCSKGERKDD